MHGDRVHDHASVGGANFERNVRFTRDFYCFCPNFVERTPFTINFVVGAFLVYRLLPQVGGVGEGSGLAPTTVFGATDTNQWHTRYGASNHEFIIPDEFHQSPERRNAGTQMGITCQHRQSSSSVHSVNNPIIASHRLIGALREESLYNISFLLGFALSLSLGLSIFQILQIFQIPSR